MISCSLLPTGCRETNETLVPFDVKQTPNRIKNYKTDFRHNNKQRIASSKSRRRRRRREKTSKPQNIGDNTFVVKTNYYLIQDI